MPKTGRRVPTVARAVLLGLAVVLGVAAGGPPRLGAEAPMPDLVELRPASFLYRASGAFTRAERPAPAPLLRVRLRPALAMMRRQVTAADYQRCVAAGQCAPLASAAPPADRPVVKVSWRDAEAYARWFSRATGIRFRLPSDEEWAYAAGSRFADDVLAEGGDGADPGERELVRYERDTERAAAVDKELRPVGGFGVNEQGLLDMAGNVWEWTESCFRRGALDAAGSIAKASVDCGIRVVEGRHRAYISDFIRDARGGGCSVGTPPAYLGFRLVRDDDPWQALRRIGEALGLADAADR